MHVCARVKSRKGLPDHITDAHDQHTYCKRLNERKKGEVYQLSGNDTLSNAPEFNSESVHNRTIWTFVQSLS